MATKPRLLDRAIRVTLSARSVFSDWIPAVLGLAGFALIGVANLPKLVSIGCGIVGTLMIIVYLVVAPSDLLPRIYARRFLASVTDPHIEVLLTSATDERLDQYLKRMYPEWYLSELAVAVRTTRAVAVERI